MLLRSLIASYLSVTVSLMTPIILTTPTVSIIANKSSPVEQSVQFGSPARDVAEGVPLAKPDLRPVPIPFSPVTAQSPKVSLSLPELSKKIGDYLQGQEGEYGLYYLDLSTDLYFGLNEQDAFTAASTAKVPVVLYLYTLIDAGKIKADEQMTYQSTDWDDGSGFIRYQKVGSRYTLADLAERALVDSDNVALKMLKRRLGERSIMAFCKKLGAQMVDSGAGETSPRSMGVYLRAVYDLAQRSPWGRTMLEQMIASTTKDRIPALLPDDIRVANKHGSLAGVINDVAIVLDERPYVLVILTRNVPYFEAPAVLAEVSKMIFEER